LREPSKDVERNVGHRFRVAVGVCHDRLSSVRELTNALRINRVGDRTGGILKIRSPFLFRRKHCKVSSPVHATEGAWRSNRVKVPCDGGLIGLTFFFRYGLSSDERAFSSENGTAVGDVRYCVCIMLEIPDCRSIHTSRRPATTVATEDLVWSRRVSNRAIMKQFETIRDRTRDHSSRKENCHVHAPHVRA